MFDGNRVKRVPRWLVQVESMCRTAGRLQMRKVQGRVGNEARWGAFGGRR